MGAKELVFIGVKQEEEHTAIPQVPGEVVKIKVFSTSCFWGFVLLFANYVNHHDTMPFVLEA